MKATITQSPEWKKLQDDLGETSFFEQGNGYQFLAILKITPIGKYLYLPYGPVYEGSNGRQNALKKLNKLAKAHQAVFIRIEPTDSEFNQHLPYNAVKTTDLNPKETWCLDITGSDENLKSKLPSRLLRYHRNAAKNGITVEISENPADISYLLKLQQDLADKKGINTFSEHYLQTELSQPFASLYLAKYTDSNSIQARSEKNIFSQDPSNEEIIAAGLVFDDRTTRYNLQGAQSEQGRKLHATGILTVQLILDAKAKGLKIFDFWGIAPEEAPANHPWAGFTNFKKTFAGYEVDHAGTYDLVLDKKKYKLYQLTRKLNRIIRRIK